MTIKLCFIVRKEMTVLTLEETIQLIRKQLPEYDRKDIMEMIEEKRQELGPEVVNEESAAMIVARELGIDLHQIEPRTRLKIKDIIESNKSVTLTAKVVHVGTIRTFSRKDGGEGKVASIKIADDSGQIRVTLWDEKTSVVSEDSEEYVSIDNIIQIRSAYVKKGLRDELELNLGRMGGIKILEDYEKEDMDFDIVSSESTKISDLVEKMYDVTLTIKVQRVFNMSTFTRKSDNTEGRVLSMMVADETGTTRLTFWDDFAEKMQDTEEDEVIRVSGAYTKTGRNGEIEVHGGRSVKVDRDLKQKIKAVESSGRAPAEALGRKSIAELELEMRDVDIEVKVLSLFPPNQFERDGVSGQVQNIIVTDESGQTIRVAFWNDDVEKIKDLEEGDILRLSHGYVKKGYRDDLEYGVGRRADIKINPKDSIKELKKLDISDITVSQSSGGAAAGRVRIGEIDDALEGNTVEICGVIVGIGQTNPVYPSCHDCRKKANLTDDGKYSCVEHGELSEPKYRMLYKITVDDGSGSIRVTLFEEAGESLLQMSAEEAQKLIETTKNDKAPIEQNSDKMLGSYIVIKGRINKYKDSLDIGASSLSFADPVEEIKRMKESIDELA
ncbi:MAG: hypothetical protein ACTSUB_01830 [Candidatus Thorarchaeota archaeon]